MQQPRRSPQDVTPTGYRAGIFDLDGVVTHATRIHCQAWRKLFDGYLAERAKRDGEPFQAFDPQDYRRYVDGAPRYDGVSNFLESRGIRLPFGSPGDAPDEETVCGLGNRKQRYFERFLGAEGVEIFASSVAFIESIRKAGIKTALISSSKNAQDILVRTGLDHLFDAVVDGIEAERLGLQGKPHPDIFRHSASLLSVTPGEAFAVEDSRFGVKAADKAGIGLVIGVDHAQQRNELLAHGADVVVDDLAELMPGHRVHGDSLPDAMDAFDRLVESLGAERPAIFLDYDGTLTPIVDRPELAVLDKSMRHTLERLAERCTVAIVSGRDRANVAELVGIDNLVYAGSHGFDIVGPNGLQMQHERAAEFLPALDEAEAQLRARLAEVPGALVERKRFAVAVHYRLVAERDVDRVDATVESVAGEQPPLRRTGGKKVFELRPQLPWDKGKAVAWLIEALGLAEEGVVPIYIGDDETDEDAFMALRERGGIGLFVGDTTQDTAASYRLSDTVAVGHFLSRLADVLGDES
ncbi:trehalose-phosphatase [Halomonas sp. McH1-25]|uniref:trehalose-phosphatase n=5 Tax=unclassified Halomonas TaxID=2609666 RepID=UPI001EF4CD6A|nr:trehalose-phosphatase [Halomonas sp. McH1-25]MCG7598574.1 trehalose-phosphatase [Halomonas sp. McH1-25]